MVVSSTITTSSSTVSAILDQKVIEELDGRTQGLEELAQIGLRSESIALTAVQFVGVAHLLQESLRFQVLHRNVLLVQFHLQQGKFEFGS